MADHHAVHASPSRRLSRLAAEGGVGVPTTSSAKL